MLAGEAALFKVSWPDAYDDPVVAGALQSMLGRWGCDVTVSANGEEALAIATRGGAPDAVITNLELPGALTGIDLVQRLAELRKSPVPAILLIGSAEGPIFNAARASGLPLLIKPFAPIRLRAFLTHAFTAAR